MSHVGLDDFECKCDGKRGIGDLNIRTCVYTCGRCGKEFGGKIKNG